ncbi:hypothetical protein [Encephalitozoon cuniculi GB-M1]|uniref:Uncharacterized protein n=2 Tax=Encephalitozoon cuniculi TaxID=6035 RepID=Q8SUF4_ENCCU|nr:uncharacterized protein ECU10_0730 [Encephalitozoon cuniculi GB-M1]AGE96285.1 hypothetical protein ECU10_0730 [Encephalitozoon cuniculi]KMV65224.1 hypothetical protein M970_100640 [Encephalitozoon cuniculi EcunIII-L]UYI26533.1 hypothetical protein J0A71_02g03620 [Encephalitozoon cuniculi]CAD25792.1 hypothetical protein [Encephalitozoon cuniculi GB-M1]
MIRDEKTLLKALEHKNIEEKSLFPSMCSVLGLQYFSEENGALTHTFAGLSFIIDITGPNAKLTFVDEGLAKCFRYIEFYLCRFLEKKSMVDFYLHLRMFAKMETGDGKVLERGSADTCRCVFDGNYCVSPSFKAVAEESTDGVYNIYRHRFEYHLYTKRFILSIPVGALPEDDNCCSLVVEDVNGRKVDARISLNLGRYLGLREFNREVLSALPQMDFYWKGTTDGREVLVQKNLAVYVDGKLRRDATFLMKLGKDLDFSLNFFGR